jgi:peptide deformylase
MTEETTIELKFASQDADILHRPVAKWGPELGIDAESLVKEMMSIMIINNGIGLTASQVGVNVAVFVIGNKDLSMACFNPRVLSVSKETSIAQEGCLSYAGLYLNIKRPSSILVEYEDVKGETQQKELSGIFARCFLHEFDHINGICFVDRASSLGLKLAKQRVNKNLKKQGYK